jgi:hypothetical protein
MKKKLSLLMQISKARDYFMQYSTDAEKNKYKKYRALVSKNRHITLLSSKQLNSIYVYLKKQNSIIGSRVRRYGN